MEYTAAQAKKDAGSYLDDTSVKQLDEIFNLIKEAALNGKTSATTYNRLDTAVKNRLVNLGYDVEVNNMAFNINW